MCGESRMHGVKRGKTRRLYQRVTYRYNLLRRLTEHCTTQEAKQFMRISQKSITEVCQILICSLADHAVSRSALRGKEALLRTTEETCFLIISKSLKPKDLAILSLKTYPTCLVYRRGNVSESCLKKFANWGIPDSAKLKHPPLYKTA